MDIIQLAQIITPIISSIGVIYVLREQIKSQQQQLDSLKSNINSFSEISDKTVTKYKDYVDFVEKAVKEKTTHEVTKVYKETLEKLSPQLAEKLMEAVDESIMPSYEELYEFTIHACFKIEKDYREGFIRGYFPVTYNEILESVFMLENGQVPDDELNSLEKYLQKNLEIRLNQPLLIDNLNNNESSNSKD